jgi:hypothetical protein
MLQEFVQNISSVSDACYKYYIWMLQIYVPSVSDVCCNCFHLSVAKVDLDVGLLSEEERASAGAMVASLWKKRGSYMSGVEEAGIRALVLPFLLCICGTSK